MGLGLVGFFQGDSDLSMASENSKRGHVTRTFFLTIAFMKVAAPNFARLSAQVMVVVF